MSEMPIDSGFGIVVKGGYLSGAGIIHIHREVVEATRNHPVGGVALCLLTFPGFVIGEDDVEF
jgi:hypothetical protein